MRFRTEIDIHASDFAIDYTRCGFIAGSCFSEHIYNKLLHMKFPVTANPTGILFNPLSTAGMLHRLLQRRLYTEGELNNSDGVWFSYDHHGSFSRSTPHEALSAINRAMGRGVEALAVADYLILTWGTAWIYRLAENGRVVANCHRQPAYCFVRKRLSAADIVNEYSALFEGPLAGKQVLLTVSPVRHLTDGFAENSLSKAVLRTAAAELTEKFSNVFYFPSFEIMNDDLRDYRFYAEDMVHPSPQAVDYIWDKFAAFSMIKSTLELLPELEKLDAAVSHRIINPDDISVGKFARHSLELIARLRMQLPGVDFSSEEEYFRQLAHGSR